SLLAASAAPVKRATSSSCVGIVTDDSFGLLWAPLGSFGLLWAGRAPATPAAGGWTKRTLIAYAGIGPAGLGGGKHTGKRGASPIAQVGCWGRGARRRAVIGHTFALLCAISQRTALHCALARARCSARWTDARGWCQCPTAGGAAPHPNDQFSHY